MFTSLVKGLAAFRRLVPGLLLLASLALLPGSLAGVARAQQPRAEVVFVHGNILTGTGLRANRAVATPGRVEALAVRQGVIEAAGTDAKILALRGPGTRVIDLHGAFVMPGFNDAHTHMGLAGRQHLALDLTGVRSLAAMKARIAAYAAKLPAGDWIVGGGWDQTLWPAQLLPTRADLDAVTGAHPTLLERVDAHIAVANSLALQATGVDAHTAVPPGGALDHGPDGALTGIVREAPALALIQAHIPPPSYDTRKRALQLSIQDALANGVTSVQDFSDWEDWLVLEEWEHEGKLPLRFAEWVDFTLPVPILEERRRSHDPNDPLLHLTQLKAFMDGSLGSRTAAMNDSYSDAPGNAGLPRFQPQRLNQMSAERAAAGFQLGFHAIGDLANDMALNAFAAAEQVGVPAPLASQCAAGQNAGDQDSGGTIVHAGEPVCGGYRPADFRFRIEHAQVVSPGAFQRFHDLGVIASMQPSHLVADMGWAGARLGPDRSTRAYAWRSFLDHGVTLAFGTDYPVVPLSPFLGLYAAVTRQNQAGTQSFHPEQRISLNEALYAYTQGSAFAEFRETEKGLLAPGYLADLAVLDRDITAVPPQSLLRTRVLRTVVGGITRYQAKSVAGTAAGKGQQSAPEPVSFPATAAPDND